MLLTDTHIILPPEFSGIRRRWPAGQLRLIWQSVFYRRPGHTGANGQSTKRCLLTVISNPLRSLFSALPVRGEKSRPAASEGQLPNRLTELRRDCPALPRHIDFF